MKKIIYLSLVAFLIVLGCAKDDDLGVNPDENQLKSGRTASLYDWDNTSVLKTKLYPVPNVYTAPTGYPLCVAENYDVMTHFEYFSQEAVTGAVVEFTFPQIKDFVPHFQGSRIFTVNNADNQTVITCTTNLVAGWNYMFCFIVKVDCGNGNSGFANVWTDMKVNGVSVKGTIKNKVFACN